MRRSTARRSTATAGVATVAALATALLGQPASAAPKSTNTERAATAAAAVRRDTPNQITYDRYKNRKPGKPVDSPLLNALCKDYIGKPNPYPNPAPNVNAIVNDGVTQSPSMAGCATAQNETTIAVNPRNPRNLVAGANDYRGFNKRTGRNDGTGIAYASFDGGQTWINSQLPGLAYHTGATGALSAMDGIGDPVIAFGPGNIVYYANLVFSRAIPAVGDAPSAMAVSVSPDGGRTWGQPNIVVLDGANPDGSMKPTFVFHDKEWMVADPNSGTLYVTWTTFISNEAGNYVESPIVVKKSTDFGKTWGPLTRISPPLAGFKGGLTPYAQGSNPQLTRDGALHVAYEASVCKTLACTDPTDHDETVVATSRDGGKTFTNRLLGLNFNFPLNADVGRSTLTGQNFRINSFPQLGYDRATDELWLTWADDRNGTYKDGVSVKTNGDTFVMRSPHGHDWTAPFRIGTDADEVFPAVAAFAGRVAVSYYTRAYDRGGVGLDYAYQVGWKQQLKHAPVRRITTASSDPRVQFPGIGAVTGKELQGVFIGDYTAVAMGSDFRFHPCWVDFRGRPGTNGPNQDVYTQSFSAFQ